MKKLIRFNVREDYGTDYYIQFLNIRKWSLLQISLSWNDYPSFPYFQFILGSNGILTTLFWIYKFGLDIDILSRTWNWDYYTENIDSKFDDETLDELAQGHSTDAPDAL